MFAAWALMEADGGDAGTADRRPEQPAMQAATAATAAATAGTAVPLLPPAAAALGAGSQAPADPAAELRTGISAGENVFAKDTAVVSQLLQALTEGDAEAFKPYTAVVEGQAAVVLRGPPPSELPLHAEVCRLLQRFVESGRQARGVLLGYSSSLSNQLLPDPPPGITAKGSFGERTTVVPGAGGVLFFMNQKHVKCTVGGAPGYKVGGPLPFLRLWVRCTCSALAAGPMPAAMSHSKGAWQ